jgi:hypothetical protein
VRWGEFASTCPELASLGEERLRAHGLCLVGTLRKNGYPRISPCEPDFFQGELLLGMMWQSPKARDLLRDPRCVIHSVVSDKAGTEGDFKLYGRAVVRNGSAIEAPWRATVRERLDWEPPDRFHLFTIDVEAAGFVVFGENAHGMAWTPEGGLRRWQQRLE